MRKKLVAGLTAAAMTLGLAGTADAAGPKHERITVRCESGTFTVAIPPGKGEFIPGINETMRGRNLHPVQFISFTAVIFDVATGMEVDRFSPEDLPATRRGNPFRHPHGTERCTFSFRLDNDPELPPGTFAMLSGELLVRGAPPGKR